MSFTVRTLKEEKRRAFPWKRTFLVALQWLTPLLLWRKHWEEQKVEDEKQHRRTMLLKRTFISLTAVLFGFVVLAGVAKALVAMKLVDFSTVVSLAGTPLPKDANGHTNVLLLGQGDEGHQGVDLTDTLIVASLDPNKTKAAVLLSIPRDLYMTKTEKMGTGRINSLYRDYKWYLIQRQGMDPKEASKEAMKELAAEISRNLGIDIHHVVKADFIGFVETVDALGGIDIIVPKDIVDTTYPTENYGYQTFAISAGPHHLDGETALKYARSRHSTSDFDRSARQQQIIQAMADKAQQAGILTSPSTITRLLQSLSKNVETTMTVGELISLGAVGHNMDKQSLVTMQINDQNGTYGGGVGRGGFLYNPPREEFGGASVLLPVNLAPYGQWGQMKILVQLLTLNREAYLANPIVHVLNAGAKSGLGKSLSWELTRYGFEVPVVQNATTLEKLPSSFVAVKAPEDEAVGKFFAELLHIPLQPLPIEVPLEEAGQVTIILGQDYAYQSFAKLLTPTPTE